MPQFRDVDAGMFIYLLFLFLFVLPKYFAHCLSRKVGNSDLQRIAVSLFFVGVGAITSGGGGDGSMFCIFA